MRVSLAVPVYRHRWWRARERVVLRLLADRQPAAGFREILDVGCGDGLLLAKLARFGRCLGLEADESLLTERGRASGEIVLACCLLEQRSWDRLRWPTGTSLVAIVQRPEGRSP